MRPPGLSSKTESCSGETGKFTSGYMLGWRYQPDLPMGCLLEHWSYWTELEKNCGIYQHIIVMKAMKIDEKANRTECLNQGHLHMTFFLGGGEEGWWGSQISEKLRLKFGLFIFLWEKGHSSSESQRWQ